jgi:MauM/NapG family ferredoxin protein
VTRLDAPHGRGEFFKALGTLVAGFVAARVEEAVAGVGPKLLRPPGALEEFDFLVACTRCDRCIRACPQGSLYRAGPQAVLAAGTPVLDPRVMPCYLCSTLPCITACPEGALVWPRLRTGDRELEGPPAVRLGLARVRPGRCLTWAGPDRPAQACRVCVDRCPYPDQAIRLGPPGPDGVAHPEVVEASCTGCGLCSFGCPTPDPAIVVEPRP